MASYKELFDVAKEKLDSEIAKEKIIAKQEAKDFFETNKKCLVDGFLNHAIWKMERCISTEFSETITFNRNIKIKSDVYIGTFKAVLSELIKNALKELSPDYCNYDVNIEETPLNSISIKITMTLCE